jgi:hypothetical protein
MGQRSNQLNYVPSRGINDNWKRAVPQAFRAMLKEVWLPAHVSPLNRKQQ